MKLVWGNRTRPQRGERQGKKPPLFFYTTTNCYLCAQPQSWLHCLCVHLLWTIVLKTTDRAVIITLFLYQLTIAVSMKKIKKHLSLSNKSCAKSYSILICCLFCIFLPKNVPMIVNCGCATCSFDWRIKQRINNLFIPTSRAPRT